MNTEDNASQKLIFKSEVMRQLMRMIERVAPSNASVLILGEAGTGKETIASIIHERSNRNQKPFVSINCGALRETLLESELFGHEKGAFTGAYSRKIGLLEVANGGTLFLENIDELSPGLQAKILRFLQEGEIYRLGGKDPISVNVRLISDTRRQLDEEVMRGNFREDLYYRINTIMFLVPSLRRRKDDIPLLVEAFLGMRKIPVGAAGISPEAMKVLVTYDWPGNVRELQNECERLNILCDGNVVCTEDLPEHIRYPGTSEIKMDDYEPGLTLHELEKRYILKALKYYDGNKTQAANALGITIKTLYNKLHEYGEFERFSK